MNEPEPKYLHQHKWSSNIFSKITNLEKNYGNEKSPEKVFKYLAKSMNLFTRVKCERG